MTKNALNVTKNTITHFHQKMQLLPFCFVGQYGQPEFFMIVSIIANADKVSFLSKKLTAW